MKKRRFIITPSQSYVGSRWILEEVRLFRKRLIGFYSTFEEARAAVKHLSQPPVVIEV